MKRLRTMMSFIFAMIMGLFTISNVYADPITTDPGTTGAGASAAASKSITINGLAEGDVVKYWKVIQWKADGSGWDFVAPFNNALNDAEKTEILGSVTEGANPVVVKGKITDSTAAKMGAAVGGESPTAAIIADGDTVTGTSWTKTSQDPGLYMALITGAAPTQGKDMVIYNPVFLAVQSDNVGSEVNLPLNYDDNGTAKKSTVTVDKKAKDDEAADEKYDEWTTQNVGDIIDFKIDTTVPAYLESWKNPYFTVKDTLSDGLTRKLDDTQEALSSIKVAVGTTELAVGEDKDYTITNNTKSGFEIKFTERYLQKITAATIVTITYQAKITSDAANVNPETNTVKIEYSRNPSNAKEHGTKEDKTTHYTFDIDANLLGNEEYTTSEIIKVAVDAAGNPITEEKTYSNTTKHHPLEGAQFQIFTDANCTNHYNNSTINDSTVFTTTDMGLINIKGLNEGTYYLKETKAAEGYMLLTEKLKFDITAEYDTVPATNDCNSYKVLKSYTVKVYSSNDNYVNAVTSQYTLNNGSIVINNGVAGDNSREVQNTKGTSLPSTGGIGTTLFYAIGAILVVGAGVMLVTRRRMSAN